LGNKCDLEEQVCVTRDELMEVAALCSIECFETSAITSVNVERAFYTII
jgi:hypothetical protein